MKNLVADIYLDPSIAESGSAWLYMGGPGGKGTSETLLRPRDIRILAYELLSAAETIDSIGAASTKK